VRGVESTEWSPSRFGKRRVQDAGKLVVLHFSLFYVGYATFCCCGVGVVGAHCGMAALYSAGWFVSVWPERTNTGDTSISTPAGWYDRWPIRESAMITTYNYFYPLHRAEMGR